MKFKSIFDKTAPAFQFYASDTMADRRWRLMSLQERGLKITLDCECWVNKSAPLEIGSLARLIGLSCEEIEKSLTERVISFYEVNDNEIISQELNDYKVILDERRKRMSEGGKKTQAAKKRNNSFDTLESNLTRSEKNREEKNGIEMNREEQVFIEGKLSLEEMKEFVDDIESTERYF
jgi:hypothetical protein